MRVLGLVPARGGSQRVPGKNLQKVGGRTLVHRALQTAVACGAFEAVALSSQDPEILAEARHVPEAIALKRPAELATAEALAYDVVVEALASVESLGHGPFDAGGLVQCTSPFTAKEDMVGSVRLLEESGAGSVVTIVQVAHDLHPFKLKRREGDRLVPLYEDDAMRPAHELPQLFVRNGSVYLSRRETIAAGSLLSDDVRGYLMPTERSLDINAPLDLDFARFLADRPER